MICPPDCIKGVYPGGIIKAYTYMDGNVDKSGANSSNSMKDPDMGEDKIYYNPKISNLL